MPASRTAPPSEAAQSRRHAAAADERPILDRLPVGVLVYRLDRLIYANRAFLDWTGHDNLERSRRRRPRRTVRRAGQRRAPRRQERLRPLSIATKRRRTVVGRSAAVQLALGRRIRAGADDHAERRRGAAERRSTTRRCATRRPRRANSTRSSMPRPTASWCSTATAASSRSTAAPAPCSGTRPAKCSGLPFASLLAPESQRAAADYLGSVRGADGARAPGEGREVTGRTRQGRLLPLFMTAGRISDGSDKIVRVPSRPYGLEEGRGGPAQRHASAPRRHRRRNPISWPRSATRSARR